MAFSKTLKEKKLVIQCDFCFKEITFDPFVQCAECLLDQCLMCFFSNIETSTHKNNHNYRVVSKVTEPLMYKGWRIIDELLLLNGIITFGVGNFEDITSVLSPKTEQEVKSHFFELFNIINNEEGEVQRNEVIRSDPNDSSVLSYMSKRGDFESEILNDYETIINNLQFSEDDSIIERKLKKHMLYHYKTVLKQRGMWKNLILDRNLVDVNRLKEMEMGDLAAVLKKYKWLIQFVSKNDFNKFIGGLVREKKLKELRTQYASEAFIDESKLKDTASLLDRKEKVLCERLKMSQSLYVKLKIVAIECYISKKPLKNVIFGYFDKSDEERVGVLYRWFKNQKVVVCDD